MSLRIFLLVTCIQSCHVICLAAPPPLEKRLGTGAQAAIVHNRLPEAVTLLRAAWEISNDVKHLQQLAQALAMIGQFEEAAETYELLLKNKPAADLAQQARSEITRLRAAPSPFVEELMMHARLPAEAKEAFKLGTAQVRLQKHEAAIRYLRAALVLDPSMPGTYRLLGAVYGKLKDPAKEQQFLLDYLRVRPDGQIAEAVRERLKPAKVLATLKVTASFPCQVWVNGRELSDTPLELLLPSGNHTVSFVNTTYHIVRNKRVRLKANERGQVTFAFGVVALKFKPWVRVRANGKDLGLWDTLGLPVGEYNLRVTAHDNSRTKDFKVNVQSGKTSTLADW